MSVVCACPEAASLETIQAFTCGENFGQIQKLAFQRLSYVNTSDVTVKNGFKKVTGTGNPITEKGSWDDLMEATDGSKIVITPFVEAPSQEGGDAITFGGGNDTLGGVQETVGRNASTITFALRKWPQDRIKALKKLQCETNLGVYFISEHGGIEAREEVESSVTYHRPIPIRSLFVGDKVHGGLEEPDSNILSFSLLPNYSDDLKILDPLTDAVDPFNPLTDLIPA